MNILTDEEAYDIGDGLEDIGCKCCRDYAVARAAEAKVLEKMTEGGVENPAVIARLRALGFVRLKDGQVVAEWRRGTWEGKETDCKYLVEVKP